MRCAGRVAKRKVCAGIGVGKTFEGPPHQRGLRQGPVPAPRPARGLSMRGEALLHRGNSRVVGWRAEPVPLVGFAPEASGEKYARASAANGMCGCCSCVGSKCDGIGAASQWQRVFGCVLKAGSRVDRFLPWLCPGNFRRVKEAGRRVLRPCRNHQGTFGRHCCSAISGNAVIARQPCRFSRVCRFSKDLPLPHLARQQRDQTAAAPPLGPQRQHPRLIGLTGNAREIHKMTSAYKVYYAKSEPAKAADRGIDHTGYMYLISRDGRYLGFFPPGTSAARMVDVIRPLVEEERHL